MWRRQRHLDVDHPGAVGMNIVNQTELVDVDRDFRIETGAQCVKHLRFNNGFANAVHDLVSFGNSYSIPNCSLAAPDIRLWVHGGSHTSCTSASSIPEIDSSLWRISSLRNCPMPQPCAVKVKSTVAL